MTNIGFLHSLGARRLNLGEQTPTVTTNTSQRDSDNMPITNKISDEIISIAGSAAIENVFYTRKELALAQKVKDGLLTEKQAMIEANKQNTSETLLER